MTAVTANGTTYRLPRRPTAVVCLDGCDPAYIDDALERRIVPRIAEMLEGGHQATVHSQLPSFTNPNNLSIVTGAPPAVHGVPGNHFRGPAGADVQLDDPAFLRAPSIHAEVHRAGVSVLAVTTKDKLRGLLAAGGVPCVSVEGAAAQPVDGLARAADAVGHAPPGIYEWNASHYALELGLALSRHLQPVLLYVSLTDAVQHAEPPGSPLSDRYLVELDRLVGCYLDAGWRLGLVADHGMNAKTGADGTPNVAHLGSALEAAGIAAHVVLPITDPHVSHHAALGSGAWVHVARSAPGATPRRCSRRCREWTRCSSARSGPPPRYSCRATGSATWWCSATATPCSGRAPADHDLSQLLGQSALARRPLRAGGSAASVRTAGRGRPRAARARRHQRRRPPPAAG